MKRPSVAEEGNVRTIVGRCGGGLRVVAGAPGTLIESGGGWAAGGDLWGAGMLIRRLPSFNALSAVLKRGRNLQPPSEATCD